MIRVSLKTSQRLRRPPEVT